MLNKGSDVKNHLSSAPKAQLVTLPPEHPNSVELKTNDSKLETANVTLRPIDEQQEVNTKVETQ
jgi:hypothetical protein